MTEANQTKKVFEKVKEKRGGAVLWSRTMEENQKGEADSNNWVVKTFGSYLPQSLSDNILVSHKFQALQCHSKKRTGGKATDTQRKRKKEWTWHKSKNTQARPLPIRATHPHGHSHRAATGPLSEVPLLKCKTQQEQRVGEQDRNTGGVKGPFYGCQRRFRGGGLIIIKQKKK